MERTARPDVFGPPPRSARTCQGPERTPAWVSALPGQPDDTGYSRHSQGLYRGWHRRAPCRRQHKSAVGRAAWSRGRGCLHPVRQGPQNRSTAGQLAAPGGALRRRNSPLQPQEARDQPAMSRPSRVVIAHSFSLRRCRVSSCPIAPRLPPSRSLHVPRGNAGQPPPR